MRIFSMRMYLECRKRVHCLNRDNLSVKEGSFIYPWVIKGRGIKGTHRLNKGPPWNAQSVKVGCFISIGVKGAHRLN